jgi:alcohol dehydrogenase
MRALHFGTSLRLIGDHLSPVVPRGEALIRPRVAGICNTDIEIVRGYFGFQGVLGHEFVGDVVACEDSPGWVGRRVVGEINAWCGDCPTCRRGDPTHCPNRSTLGIYKRDGAMAEYFTLPAKLLLEVPSALSDEEAVFTEPLAAACEILEQIHLRPTDRVHVIGDGKLGLLVAQVLQLTGCDLTVIGKHEAKLAILKRRGVRTCLLNDLPPGLADVVVEATGNPDGFALARRLLRPRGTLILKSTYHGAVNLDLSMVVVDEIRLVGSRCGPFSAALRLLEQGLVDVKSLISETHPFSKAEEAFARAAAPGVLKVLLTF